MGWERRQRGGAYYVMKTRYGSMVVSHYVGKGETAQAIAYCEAGRQVEKAYHAALWCEERAGWEEVQNALSGFCEAVLTLFTHQMEAAGYHRHNRGKWRRRRVGSVEMTQKRMTSLEQRARTGDQKAAQELFAHIDKTPGHLALLCHAQYQRTFSYVQARSGKDLILRKAIGWKVSQLQEGLAREGDTDLETLLIKQIVLCEVVLQDAMAHREKKMQTEEGLPLDAAKYYDRIINSAHRRFLSSVQSLGVARRLRLPAKEAEQEQARLRMIAGGKVPGPVEIEEAA